MTHFALGTFSTGAGLVVGDSVLSLREGQVVPGPATVLNLLEQWDAALPVLRALADEGFDGVPIGELQVLPPLVPRQIFQAGANYRKHVAQMMFGHAKSSGDTRPDDEIRAEVADAVRRRGETGTAFLFAGLPSAIAGPGDDVLLPPESSQCDWEIELTAVIGKPAHRVSVEDALDHVAGYTISNDLSARDLQYPPEHKALGIDWMRAKNRPTFLPIGPFVVPGECLGDLSELRMTLKLNGDVMQDETTDDMIFTVAQLVSAASQTTTLYPGDLVLTGSPAGNGGHWKRWLKAGDVMEASITGIGTLRNACVDEK